MCAKARQQPRMPEQCSTKGQQRQARPSVATNARQQPQPVQMQQQEKPTLLPSRTPVPAQRCGCPHPERRGLLLREQRSAMSSAQHGNSPVQDPLQPKNHAENLYSAASTIPPSSRTTRPNTKTKPKSAPRRRPVKMTSPIWVKVSHLAWSVHVCTHVYRYTLYACLHVCRSASMDVWMRVSARILHVYIRSRAQVSNLPKTGSQHRLQR